jgi:hypothetical protein
VIHSRLVEWVKACEIGGVERAIVRFAVVGNDGHQVVAGRPDRRKVLSSGAKSVCSPACCHVATNSLLQLRYAGPWISI